jgi:hypothetical protein
MLSSVQERRETDQRRTGVHKNAPEMPQRICRGEEVREGRKPGEIKLEDERLEERLTARLCSEEVRLA